MGAQSIVTSLTTPPGGQRTFTSAHKELLAYSKPILTMLTARCVQTHHMIRSHPLTHALTHWRYLWPRSTRVTFCALWQNFCSFINETILSCCTGGVMISRHPTIAEKASRNKWTLACRRNAAWRERRQALQEAIPDSFWTALDRYDDGSWTAYTPGFAYEGACLDLTILWGQKLGCLCPSMPSKCRDMQVTTTHSSCTSRCS